MKKQLLLICTILLAGQFLQAQTPDPVFGQYEGDIQQGINTDNDVVIARDPQSSKKIWVSGILKQGRFYATLNLKTEDQQQYTIPAQTVNGKAIRNGWIILKINKEDEGKDQIIITNDPKSNPNSVVISDKGITVKDDDGEEMVNMSNGKIEADAGGGNQVKMNQKKNTIEASAGDMSKAPYFTYIGYKPTTKTGDE